MRIRLDGGVQNEMTKPNIFSVEWKPGQDLPVASSGIQPTNPVPFHPRVGFWEACFLETREGEFLGWVGRIRWTTWRVALDPKNFTVPLVNSRHPNRETAVQALLDARELRLLDPEGKLG